MTDKPTKCSCYAMAATYNHPTGKDMETPAYTPILSVVRCDWCKGLEEYLAISDAFCEVAAKMDSFDYHPLMIAWKKLQNWRE